MKELKDYYYWTMKNGERIYIDDMTEEHLRNTLKMIIRNRILREEARRQENDWLWK